MRGSKTGCVAVLGIFLLMVFAFLMRGNVQPSLYTTHVHQVAGLPALNVNPFGFLQKWGLK